MESPYSDLHQGGLAMVGMGEWIDAIRLPVVWTVSSVIGTLAQSKSAPVVATET